VGPSTFNRSACLAFYPHAKTKNAAIGPQTEHFCKAGSTAEVCTGIVEDTCVMAVSSSQQVSCESTATNVDSFFVECADPFSPEIIEQMGGTVPPLSPPQPRNDGSGLVDYTVTITHPQQIPTLVRVEYSTDGGLTYQQATLASVNPSEGVASLQNTSEYQIGTTDAVDTDEFESIVLDFVWDAFADEVTGDAILRITVQDASLNTTSDITETFEIDGVSHGSAEDELLARPTPPSVEVVEDNGFDVTSRDRGENFQNCLSSEGNEETPCESSEEITEFLDALVSNLVTDADLSEKERGKAEFIKRYLALQQDGQTLEEKLQLFDHGMTRGEAMEIIVFLLSAHGVLFQNGNLPLEYSDVTHESPYAQSIAYATAYGIVEGYPDGTFRPDMAPNLAEVSRIVVRAGALIKNSIQDEYSNEVLSAEESDWFVPYIKTLQSSGIFMPTGYEALGKTVSGLRMLDILYDLLFSSGISEPFSIQ
jgi:hypothetical protein